MYVQALERESKETRAHQQAMEKERQQLQDEDQELLKRRAKLEFDVKDLEEGVAEDAANKVDGAEIYLCTYTCVHVHVYTQQTYYL